MYKTYYSEQAAQRAADDINRDPTFYAHPVEIAKGVYQLRIQTFTRI